MRRQLVASAAAITTAAAVGLALPAVAFHDDEPQLYTKEDVKGGNVTCEFLGLVSFGEDGKIEFDGDQPDVIEDIEEYFDLESFDPPIVAVIVKGGPASNVYDEPPFVNLVAPGDAAISHIEVCGGEEETPTPTPTDTPTETPTKTPTESPMKTPTESPTTPAPVPTEVPAGANDGTSGSPALLGLVLAGSAAMGGAAVVARRRFLHDS